MKDFFKKNKKIIDIYIILGLITAIICILFIVFPEITKKQVSSIKSTGIETKDNLDDYFTKKIIENHKKNIEEDVEVKHDSEDNLYIEDNTSKDKIIKDMYNNSDEKQTVLKKYLLEINNYKDHYLNDTIILNFVEGKYELDENNVIMDENKVNNIAFKVNDYKFDKDSYQLTFYMSLKELNNDFTLNTENFYFYIDDTEIKTMPLEVQTLNDEEIDINVTFILDKSLNIEDLSLDSMKLVYIDSFNYRNILLKGDIN